MDGNTLKGLILSVKHVNYGTLFAAMIKGTGSLISETTERGVAIPFLTTEQILEQISKFGFIVRYDLKSNLPDQVITYLSTLYNLGYDKITRLGVRVTNKQCVKYVRPTIVVMKSCKETLDIMKFDTIVSDQKFNYLLDLNVALNVTDEPDMVWDWLHYMCNIHDILEENIDPTDDFETQTDIEVGHMHPFIPSPHDCIAGTEGYSIYEGEGDEEEENDGEEG